MFEWTARMTAIPPLPPARGYETSGTAELFPRYEDITQDGRFLLPSLTPGLGAALWRSLGKHTSTLDAFTAEGILPILRRIIIAGEPGPFSVHEPVRYEGTWRLARETDGERLFLDMWLEARSRIGGTFDPIVRGTDDGAGGRGASGSTAPRPRALAGRIYAEHVITKPFAPKDARKVTRLDAPGLPAVPEDTQAFESADELIAGHTLVPAGEVSFAMMHTDSNQHVNSLVYPRVFEEAIVRSLAPRPTLVARTLELRWRKPFFAGERARITLAVVASEGSSSAGSGELRVVGAFTPTSSDLPSATVAMTLA
jgi:hypothetical protein